jgi:glycosyltransferase involved in cell wall biosynthesis
VLREPSADGTVLVLSVGRLAAEKRHDVLIEAVARSRHRSRIRLVIAGPGHIAPELRRRAESLPNPAQIGFVDRSRFQELLETANLYVHPSDVELEGMAVVEAMSVGLPVLVSDSSESAAAEFALESRFRFRSGDAADLAARMDALLDRPAELCDAGRRYADFARTLDFGHSVEHLVQVYRSLLAAD